MTCWTDVITMPPCARRAGHRCAPQVNAIKVIAEVKLTGKIAFLSYCTCLKKHIGIMQISASVAAL